MKKRITVLMIVTLAMMMAGCAATFIDTSQGRDGSSFRNAVVVGSVRAEYLYIDRTYPGSNILTQVVTDNNGNPYDIITITTKDGTEKDIYFDISRFYRKKTYADDLE